MQRYGVFFILQIFLQLFLKVFYNMLIMSGIFFLKKNSERLGETQKGVRAARAEMGVVGGMGAVGAVGCEPHGQGWER